MVGLHVSEHDHRNAISARDSNHRDYCEIKSENVKNVATSEVAVSQRFAEIYCNRFYDF